MTNPQLSTVDSTTSVRVQDYVRESQAADPDDGERLAALFYTQVGRGVVHFDFTGVRGMNSGFSNAFFLALMDAGIGEDLILEHVAFRGLTEFQRSVVVRSRSAVIQRIREERGAK